MLRDAKGNRLYRKLEVLVIYPDNIMRPDKIREHAGPKKGISDENIDEVLMRIADALEVKFPWWEFKAIPLAPEHRTAKYVVKCIGPNPNYKPPEHVATVVGAIDESTQPAPTV